MTRKLAATALALVALLALSPALAAPRSQQEVVSSVANMTGDAHAQQLAGAHGLQVLNVMWEDTGRYLGSSVGPNISDVTIEVQIENQQSQLVNYLMPVIRYPNFTDKTGDIDIDKFFVRVGNEKEGRPMQTITLRQLLAHPTRYMSLPQKGTFKGGSLLAKRDEKVLVSAQSAFLPVRQGGKATFFPVIFNYQSYEKNPAVLTILVTRQGTSMTIIDNNRDTVSGPGSWGQRLFFNKAGQRAPLTAERLKDVQASGVTSNGESAASLGKDSNLLMIIQVPLVVKTPARGGAGFGYGLLEGAEMAPTSKAAGSSGMALDRMQSDIDVAVLGHGRTEGPYTELDGLSIERDDRFPVRVTVQFYQATSNGVVSEADMKRMAAQIGAVYKKADYVGSLVIPDGEPRPTMWTGATTMPAGTTWWSFPGLVERWNKYGSAGVRWYRRFFADGTI